MNRKGSRRRVLRWTLAAGTCLAVLVAGGGWLVFSDVAIPGERFTSSPDPCALVSRQTVARLIGDAAGEPYDPDRAVTWGERPMSRPAETVGCRWEGSRDRRNTIEAEIDVYFGTKFGLGSSGEDRAEFQFPLSCTLPPGVVYESRQDGHVCVESGPPYLPTLDLYVWQANLFGSVRVRSAPLSPLAEEYPWDPEAEAERLATEVMARLDDHAASGANATIARGG